MFDRRRRAAIFLIAVLVTALGLRLTAALALPLSPPVADAKSYDLLARSLSSGDGYSMDGEPSARRPPLYPALLALLYLGVGADQFYVRTAQAFVDVLTVVLVYWLSTIVFDRRVAVVAAAAIALHPGLIRASTLLLTETVTTFLITLFMVLLVESRRLGRLWLSGVAGFVLGLTILARPTPMLLPAALLCCAPALRDRWRPARQLLIMWLMAWLTVAPWVGRNVSVFGSVVLSTGLGPNMFAGSYGAWQAEWNGLNEPPIPELVGSASPDTDRIRTDRILLRQAVLNIVESPSTYLRLCWLKFLNLLRPTPAEPSEALGSVVLWWSFRMFHVALILFCVVGLTRRLTPDRLEVPILATLAYWVLFHVVTFATPRYLLPVFPLIAVVAARGLVWSWSRWRWWPATYKHDGASRKTATAGTG